MLKPISDVAIPALAVLAMLGVGLGLTMEDFRRVGRRPWLLTAATLGQIVLLPLIALVLVRLLDLSLAVERGLLLTAASPAGSMAILYAYWARANVALSVSLTAVSCLAAVLGMPMLMVALQEYLGESESFGIPIPAIIEQLLLTFVPILLGMAVRRRWPAAVERLGRWLFALSTLAIGASIGLVIVQEREHLVSDLPEMGLAVVILAGLSFAAGWLTGWLFEVRRTIGFTVATVFVARNVGVATAIAVMALNQVEFAAFATAYYFFQIPLVLGAILVFRWRRVFERHP
jgi:BASS family bile acid:Na+ symporter